MRTLKIDNPKVAGMIGEKDDLVKIGISISKEIEKIEKQIEVQNDKERKYTEKVTPEIQAIIDLGDAAEKELQERMNNLEKLGNDIMKMKLALIPKDVMEKHYALRAEKEGKERERNKIGLKVQKFKDRLVPMIRKILVDVLDEYEDTETVQVKNGKLEIVIFSHLEEWKQKFIARKAKPIPATINQIVSVPPTE